jgi:putative ABC transport system substrate-binding protein
MFASGRDEHRRGDRLNRRAFLCGLGGASLLCGPDRVAAQRRTPRVAVLRPTSASNPYTESFRCGLRDLGYIEGKNIHIDDRYSEGHQKRLPALAAELVALKPTSS